MINRFFVIFVIVIFMMFWCCWSAHWKIFCMFNLWNWARNFTLWFISVDFGSLVVGYLCFTGFVLVVDDNVSSFNIFVMSDNGYVSYGLLDFFSMMNKLGLFSSSVG
jgi:hypothetical protein